MARRNQLLPENWKLKPLVYEVLYNMGDQSDKFANPGTDHLPTYPDKNGAKQTLNPQGIRGNAKPLPFINCTSYSTDASGAGFSVSGSSLPANKETDVPWINCVVGAIIVPPSRLHELFYRMVVEWTLEFSQIRPIGEVTDWTGLSRIGNLTHYQNYSYAATKEAVTGTKDSILTEDTCMVSTTAPIEKVF